MKKPLITLATLLTFASTSAYADSRFLKAVALFLIGDIQLEYKVTSDNVEAVGNPVMKQVVFQDENDPCVVHHINIGSQALHTPTLLKAITVNFSRMPSPRAFRSSFTSGVGGAMMSWIVYLPADAMCESDVQRKDDRLTYPLTGKCFKSFSWADTNARGTGPLRLEALGEIRRNFCAGLPE
jgi:hypothetical protein